MGLGKFIMTHIFDQSNGKTIPEFFYGCDTPLKIANRVAQNIYPLMETRPTAQKPEITLHYRKGNCYDQASLVYEGIMWLRSLNKFSETPQILIVNGQSTHAVCVYEIKKGYVIIDTTRNPDSPSWKDGEMGDRGWYYESDITDDTKLARFVKPDVKTFHFNAPDYV